MSGLRSRLIVFLFLAALLITAFYVSASFFVKPSDIRREFIPKLEDILQGDVEFEAFKVRHFPTLTIQLSNVQVRLRTPRDAVMKAPDIYIRLRLLAALMGKNQLAAIEINKGDLSASFSGVWGLNKVDLREVDLRLSRIREKKPMKVTATGGWVGHDGTFETKGWVLLPSWEAWELKHIAMDCRLKWIRLPANALESLLAWEMPAKFKRGNLDGELTIRKAQDTSKLEWEGYFEFKELIYQIRQDLDVLTSLPLQGNLRLDWVWDHPTEELVLKNTLLETPIGSLEVIGDLLVGTGEIRNMRVSLMDMQMENIPQYYLPLKHFLPVNVGFSGLSNAEMSVEGTLDYLNIHANWDLESSLLAYSPYFVKPKDMSVVMTIDALLKDIRLLSGDFSTRLQGASIKGSLKEFDFRTGDGQLNIITNKFRLADWQPLILPLADYSVDGDFKILANFEGDLDEIKKTDQMINLSLTDGKISKKDGRYPVQNMRLVMDYSSLALDIKEAYFEMGESSVKGSLKIYNLAENQLLDATLEAPRLAWAPVTEAALAFWEPWLKENSKDDFERVRQHLTQILPTEEALEDVLMTLKYEEGQWMIPKMQFKSYGGQTSMEGAVDFNSEFPTYWLGAEVNKMSLAKYSSEGRAKPLLGGNLFLKVQLAGVGLDPESWSDHLQGEGQWIMTNGEFYTLDLMGALSEIENFGQWDLAADGLTSFDDFHTDFLLRDGKIVMDHFSLSSSQLLTEGEGTIRFDGNMNFGLETYLSTQITGEDMPILSTRQTPAGRMFGPVPLLLAGPLDHPQLKADPKLLTQFLDRWKPGERTQRILRNFLREDFLFDLDES